MSEPKLTIDRGLRIINAILELNAALLDQPVKIRATRTGRKGWIRVGYPNMQGTAYSRSYPNIQEAVDAAFEAHAECRRQCGWPT